MLSTDQNCFVLLDLPLNVVLLWSAWSLGFKVGANEYKDFREFSVGNPHPLFDGTLMQIVLQSAAHLKIHGHPACVPCLGWCSAAGEGSQPGSALKAPEHCAN
jgi:hypothetical protein